ncbi:unnamed protein product [Diamesa tonsa]
MSFDRGNLPEIIDLALGLQNSGLIDFNLLRKLLHVIVEQLSNISIECELGKRKDFDCENENSINNKSIMNVKTVKTFEDKTNPQTAINIAHAEMSYEAFKHIESLHDSLSTIMSNKDRTIADISKENCNLKTITTRVDDIEKSIKHLTSLSNDLTREFHKIQQNIVPFSDSKEIENLKDRLDVLQQKIFNKNSEVPMDGVQYQNDHFQETNRKLQFSNIPDQSYVKIPEAFKEELPTFPSHSDFSLNAFPPTLNQSKSCAHMKTYTTATSTRESQQLAINDLWLEIGDMKNFYIRTEVASNFDMLTDRFNEMENRLTDIDLKMINFENDLELYRKIPRESDMQSFKKNDNEKSVKRIESLSNLVEQHTNNITYLLNDREQNVKTLNSVKNQMNFLKESKVDRDDLDVILAEKADYNVVQNKVSIDQFDATKRDISQNLIDIITQITDKEMEWQKSLNEMHNIVESKLDKEEIAPFKNYIKQKVNGIQDRLKTLATLKSDAEAAGTKKEIMKHLKCISCNSEAVMRTKEQLPRIQPFIPSRNLTMKNTFNSNKLLTKQFQFPSPSLMHPTSFVNSLSKNQKH